MFGEHGDRDVQLNSSLLAKSIKTGFGNRPTLESADEDESEEIEMEIRERTTWLGA